MYGISHDSVRSSSSLPDADEEEDRMKKKGRGTPTSRNCAFAMEGNAFNALRVAPKRILTLSISCINGRMHHRAATRLIAESFPLMRHRDGRVRVRALPRGYVASR